MSFSAGGLALNLLLLAAPFLLLKLEGVKNNRLLKALFIRKEKIAKLVFRTLVLIGAFFLVLLVENSILTFLGFADQRKVADIVLDLPLLSLLLAVTVGPIAEELFFRGYLQQKIGIVLTSLIFAGFHYGYGSISEIIAAFSISIVLGLELRKNKNVLPCILAHAFYNLFSVVLIYSVYG
jgi:membrane protease YdiL (CAAX protease family)